jgi:hypothetical protein
LLVLAGPAQAEDKPLVDCTQKRFKSGNKAASLIGWSNYKYKVAKKARDNKSEPLASDCEALISMRGDAHCQELGNGEYRAALVAAQAVCPEKKPEPKPEATGKAVASSTSDGSMVDCKLKRFQSGTSARGLMGFSSKTFRDVKATEGSGIYPKFRCDQLISQRGDAHCQKLDDREIRTALQEAMDLCHRLENPAPAEGKMAVDCKLERFQKKASFPDLIRWSYSGVKKLDEWSAVQAEAKCQEAYSHAGSAHCLLPAKKQARKAIYDIATACADDAERRQAARKAAAEAEIARKAQIKASRVIVKLPKFKFKGGAAKAAKQMKRALLAAGLAKSKKEILKVVPMGSWQTGIYSNTKVPYRLASGMVLYRDDDNDGVCRFTSYNFDQKKRGKSWTTLAVRSFCAGCAEGWTKCKKAGPKK